MGFWRSFIKEWFVFSRGERQGVWVLIIVVVGAVLVAKFYPEPAITLADPSLISEAKRINDLLKEDSTESFPEITTPPHTALALTPFNPNDVTKEQLQGMGLPEKAIKSLLGYRTKGGVFRKAEDVKKLYGLTPELTSQIIPLLIIPDSLSAKGSKSLFVSKWDSLNLAARFPIEINGTDSVSLILIKGIGPTLAHKIITYRRRLGGFYHSDQLLDIYGFRAENIQLMKDQITIDTSKLVKWSLNTLSPDSLAKHPYISIYQANAIEFYRGKVGKIRSMDELVYNRILPPAVARKLRPYAKF